MANKKEDENEEEVEEEGEEQTDLAEGEPDTVDESIKEHERKKDQNA
jgi:hypothetical protein